mmetsp:Transcript_26820/g.68141  ORF Transcript_26820/g.68141 Transcript_26820/m.68141 type:complete len:246 (-) Transcript_26820:950-1687(-)
MSPASTPAPRGTRGGSRTGRTSPTRRPIPSCSRTTSLSLAARRASRPSMTSYLHVAACTRPGRASSGPAGSTLAWQPVRKCAVRTMTSTVRTRARSAAWAANHCPSTRSMSTTTSWRASAPSAGARTCRSSRVSARLPAKAWPSLTSPTLASSSSRGLEPPRLQTGSVPRAWTAVGRSAQSPTRPSATRRAASRLTSRSPSSPTTGSTLPRAAARRPTTGGGSPHSWRSAARRQRSAMPVTTTPC